FVCNTFLSRGLQVEKNEDADQKIEQDGTAKPEDNKAHKAATKIQASFRGHITRKKMKDGEDDKEEEAPVNGENVESKKEEESQAKSPEPEKPANSPAPPAESAASPVAPPAAAATSPTAEAPKAEPKAEEKAEEKPKEVEAAKIREDRNTTQRPHPSVNLTLHPSLTRKQDPEILKLLPPAEGATFFQSRTLASDLEEL
uniref:Neuromodulin n=1 Tax=Periophthalmus magnuspinnatus TaxID=409849 RepID=A0A3B3ZMN1_9GOBI